MKIGYTRVSTRDQEAGFQDQLDRLSAAGCERVFAEKISGKTADRPQLQEMIGFARRGDVIVGTKIDRMFRNLRDALEIHDSLAERGIGLTIMDFGVDTSTPIGRLLFQMLAAFAELEPNMMRERQAIGIEAAREAGKYLKTHRGWRNPVRSPKAPQNKMRHEYSSAVIDSARAFLRAGAKTVPYQLVAEEVGCSRATVHRILSEVDMIQKRSKPSELEAAE